MSKLKFSGPISLRLKSFYTINRIAILTYIRHLAGIRMAPDWDANLEIGIRFWRHQFTAAMTDHDFGRGRLLFDSLQTQTDDRYDVSITPCASPKGHWYRPDNQTCDATILYFHGGGYAFNSALSARFAAMLAHRIGATVFAPDYRLTPEHPHPAQAEDALTAWSFLTDQMPPKDIVLIGDSAGGHMALTLLQTLKDRDLEQPVLCIGLCPWTDIGNRGASLHDNDWFDMVQGWMALQFGKWLDPDGRFGCEDLSPIFQDFSDTAPIYLQSGGREILHDMIVEFSATQKAKGADISIDVWPDMPHDFQAYDTLKSSSSAALTRVVDMIKLHRKS